MASSQRSSVVSPFAVARRYGLFKGLLGGDRKWRVIGGLFWGAHLLRKTIGKVEQVVTIEKMEPGQWMSLRTIPAPTRKQRRAARKAR